jgi:hypothetical protein
MKRYLEFNHKMTAVRAKEMYKDMQKKTKSLKISSFFIEPSVCSLLPCNPHCSVNVTPFRQEH